MTAAAKILLEGLKLLEPYSAHVRTSGCKSEETIREAEALLALKFPPSYRLFLSTFGEMDFMAQEFFGILDDDLERDLKSKTSAIGWTLDKRENTILPFEKRFPKEMFKIGDVGDGSFYCIDTRIMYFDQESPIVLWTPGADERTELRLEVTDIDYGSYFLQMVTWQIEYHEEELKGKD